MGDRAADVPLCHTERGWQDQADLACWDEFKARGAYTPALPGRPIILEPGEQASLKSNQQNYLLNIPGLYPPASVRKETERRFQPLMATTTMVRSTSSFSEKWARTAS